MLKTIFLYVSIHYIQYKDPQTMVAGGQSMSKLSSAINHRQLEHIPQNFTSWSWILNL